MKTLYLALSFTLLSTVPAMADRVVPVGIWDCVINNVGEPEGSAYAYRAQSTIYTTGHNIHFKEVVPSLGYTASIKSRREGEGQNYYDILFNVEWIAPEGVAADLMGEAGYNVMIPKNVESFAVKLKKSFNYGPEKIICYKSQE